MKNLNSLKKLIKLLFFIFFGSLFVYLIKGLFAFMENDLSYLGECETNSTLSIIFLLFFIKVISKTVFFIGGFYLIKILDFNNLKEVFSTKKILLFKKSGKLFLLSSLIGSLTIGFEVLVNGIGNLKSNTDFLYSLYFSAIIGLFLIIFSKVLFEARELKQENDLTI